MSTPTPRSSWLKVTKDAFTAIVVGAPRTAGASLESVYYACDLLDEASRMQAQVKSDGMVAEGSMGQPVGHPLIPSVLQYRREALAILRALGLTARSATSSAGAALAGKRWATTAPGSSSVAAATGTDNVTPIRARRDV